MAKVMTYREARTAVIAEEMHRDPTIFYISRSRNATREKEFGMERERFNICGISETQVIGAGVGAAFAGTRPIVSMGRGDFLLDAWGQICLQAAKLRFKIGYKTECPLIIMMGVGGPAETTVHHSAYYANWVANCPGLLVPIPATAADVAGIWRTALRDAKDAVVMLEPSGVGNMKGSVPDGDYTIPFGKADVKREGSDVTICAVGYWVHRALEVAEDLANEGIDAEVWDPRTLTPLDRESLIRSVKKTGAMVVVDRATKSFGTTGEFIATVAEALTPVPPIARVATMDIPMGAAPANQDIQFPTNAKIMSAVKGVLERKG